MKIKNIITFSLAVWCAPLLANLSIALAIHPYLAGEERQQVRNQTLGFLLQEAPAGTEVLVLDGSTGHVVETLTIPELRIDSASARQIQMRKELGTILRWFKKEPASGYSDEPQALNTPAIATALARHDVDALLMVGSPIYHDPAIQQHSWRRGDELVYPGDGAFFVTGGASPWAVNIKHPRLGSTDVHWLVAGKVGGLSGAYAEGVKRFLGLYCELEGGQLVSFSSDAGETFAGLLRDDLPGFDYELDLASPSMAMRRPAELTQEKSVASTPPQIEIPDYLFAKPIERVLVVDITQSMGEIYPYVARTIASMPKGENTLLLTFSDHSEERVVTVFEESADPADHARALRSIELVDGVDTPEALGDALRAVREELEARPASRSIEILIWTDAPAKAATEVPTGIDYAAEMRALMAAGHRIVVVRCALDQDLSWLPAGVRVSELL